MLFLITLQETFWTALMGVLAAITTAYNIYIVKRSNARFKRTEMDKKADKSYVDDEISNVEKRTDLKIESLKESQEETNTILEHMSKQVDFIYQAHFKA
jgi:hypothetical protein